ncbi:hypothetical protein FQN51_003385 [Onygenales sp. PD_10]|nr:hypothetical protein FQN51_003385 [Onygenales sp. PD_10]
MLAARDQENLVHAHQTAAAAKPMNHGARQLQPKTPGNRAPKTPFKVPLNDENNPLAFGGGRKTGKANNGQNENLLRPGKDGIGGGNALVTPMGPRNRAPLGMKTTNAKAKNLQTPAPPLGTAKPGKTAKRSSTRKLKQSAPEIQPAQTSIPTIENVEEEVPDIEYMPPEPQALPDPPEDIPYDTDFPQFKGKNFTRGWHKLYVDNEVGADGMTRKEREMKAQQEAYEKEMDAMIQQQVDNMELLGINVRQFPDEPCAEEVAQDILKKREQKQAPKKIIIDRSVSTIKSRNAAKMLSQQPRSTVPPKPKASSAPKARFSSGLLRAKKQPIPANPSPMRHAAATASSRTTVGYSKGRRVSSNLRQKTPKQATSQTNKSDILSPARYMELYGTPPFGSEMWSRCKAAGYFDSEATDTEEILDEIPHFPEEDEEAANFQLTF